MHLAYLPTKIVRIFGTPQQQQKFLAPLVKGEWVSAVSFTEPDHGSDLTRMDTTLEEKEDGFVLNGTKIFTTNAAYADFFIILAQQDQEASPGKGMTTILVQPDPSSWLGGKMEINEIPHKMGLRMTSSGELVFHDLKLPKENILGERGRGLLNVLDFLDESRIEITGSLHKYHNKGKHNYDDFTIFNLANVLIDLSRKFGINWHKTELHGIENSLNIKPPHDTNELLDSLLVHKRKKFKDISRKEGKSFKLTRNYL